MFINSRMLTIARFSLLEAVCDRFLLLIFIGLILAFLLAVFIGELAITESVHIQTAVLAYALRLFSVFAVSLFVITSMLREFNDKGFALILSLPIARATYFLGKLCGYAIVAALVSVCVAVCVTIFMPGFDVIYWSVSLYCELLIIITLSLLCLFTLNNVTLAFTLVVGFYLLSRSMAAIQLISDAPIMETTNLSHYLMGSTIDILAYLTPDLYNFTRTDWLIYGIQDNSTLYLLLGQTLIYMLLLSAAALFDLYRKEF